MKNHYQTTTDKVLSIIESASPEEQEMGGIILPAGTTKASLTKNAIAEMVVHSVGPDCKTVKVGDRVLFNKHQVTPLPCQDGEMLILPEGQVLCVVTEVVEKPADEGSPLPVQKKPLTVEEIRAALDQQEKPPLVDSPDADEKAAALPHPQ